jgi:hypothetical protein
MEVGSGEALKYLHQKTSMPIFQTSDNTNPGEKGSFSIRTEPI